MLYLTDFGDQAVVQPLALLVALSLLVAGWPRGAAAWMLVVYLVMAVILAGKMAAHACGGIVLPEAELRSPSGHTAMAAVAYGSLCGLLTPRDWHPRLLAGAAAAVVALLIGASRIALRAHTTADVIAGIVVGVAGAILLVGLAGPRPQRVHRAPALMAALLVVLVFHGAHLHAEDTIHHYAFLLWPLTLCGGDIP